jgi:arylsulfate sulfotransferase
VVFEIDENAKTATVLSDYQPPASFYSFFGGNVDLLANGNLHADFCAPKNGAVIQELKHSDGGDQVVWQAATPGASQFHATRLPSLYPGVQW